MTPRQARLMERAVEDVTTELRRALQIHGPMRGPHEGWAVIREEVDELWDGVKTNADQADLRGEAKQVAAMALRFMIDVCGEEG